MTKVVEFKTEERKINLKPIEFYFHIGTITIIESLEGLKPIQWDYISLVSLSSSNDNGLDLICAWDNPNNKVFFWGKWNDGIISAK